MMQRDRGRQTVSPKPCANDYWNVNRHCDIVSTRAGTPVRLQKGLLPTVAVFVLWKEVMRWIYS